MLVSSESFHWTWQDLDTCPRVDTCPQSNMSSENFHGSPHKILCGGYREIYVVILVFVRTEECAK